MTPSDNSDQLRTILNLCGNGVMLFECLYQPGSTSLTTQLILANKQAEALTGLSEQLMWHNSLLELIPPLANSREQIQRVIDTGEPYETELKYSSARQAADQWYTVLIQKYEPGLALSFTNITRLKHQSTLVESILNGSINGLIAYEGMRTESGQLYDLRVRLANEAAARIVNTSLDKLTDNSIKQLYPSIQESGLFDRYAETIETGEPQRFENHYIQDGLNGWYDISAIKFNDGLLLSFLDVSATKQYELGLQKLIENLRQSNKNLEQFAYIASHDLQEPLRKILSFGDMLLQQSDNRLSEDSIQLITRMRSAAGRMNVLIHDLLTFSRLSSQKKPFQRIDLQAAVDEVLSDLESTIRDKQAIIEITSLPVVLGDGVQLRQAFQNLLSNALKFTQKGRIPAIRIDCHQVTGRSIQPLPGQTVAETDLDRSFYEISVEDNGIGFDEVYLDQIFTVFQRLHTRNEYQGTGIGLAIVQKVIQNHGGYVTASSQPGKGALFTVYLPQETAPVVVNGLTVA